MITIEKTKSKGIIENYKTLRAKYALYIENITKMKGEEEFIFPSGTEFFIDGVEFQ